MLWYIIPIVALNILMVCGLNALRDKWHWYTFAILLFSIAGQILLWQCFIWDLHPEYNDQGPFGPK